MTNGLFTTAIGLVPHMYKQELISNNIANINTTGYKKDGLFFRQILEGKLYPKLYQGDSEFLPNVEDSYIDFQQGSLVSTGNKLDIALTGQGFLALQTPQGIAYTRNGNFTINEEQQLVSNLGYPVLGEDGIVELDNAEDITISEQGEIFIKGMQINKFMLVDFDQPQALKKFGNGLLVPRNPNVRELQAENIRVNQGYLEQSNVNVVEEMVEMIRTLSQFESIQRTFKLQNDSIGKAVNELGRLK